MYSGHECKQDWPGHRMFHLSVPKPPTPHTSCLPRRSLTPFPTHRRPEGWDGKGMLKSGPSALPNLLLPCPHAGVRREHRSEEIRPPEEKGRAGPGGWGMHGAPSSGRGVSGRPAPYLPRGRRKAGPSREQRAMPLNIREQL